MATKTNTKPAAPIPAEAPAEPKPPRTITFRQLKNALLPFSNGVLYQPRVSFTQTPLDMNRYQPHLPIGEGKPVAEGDSWVSRASIVTPKFDLEGTHHVIDFGEIDPQLPERGPLDTSDTMWKMIEEEAFANTRAARDQARLLIADIKHHVKQGNIEVVSDPSGLLDNVSMNASPAMIAKLRAEKTA